MDSSEKQYEIGHLSSILVLIEKQIALLEQELADSKDQMADINADMWENAHHFIYDFDDVVELQQRSMDFTIHANWAKRNHLKLTMLHKMMFSPYFGRIDFSRENRMAPEQIYIGINSLTVQSEVKPRVYDWRAPISSMFYDCGVGEASYISPSGKVEGFIQLKRQYKIKYGELEYLFDSDLAIDDDILQRELSMKSESKLRTIINSIQKEQNYAIRYNAGENVIVFGAAGSGKTSIGLHRLAYQLYLLRGHIASENILIVSQNNIFNSYISDIIPELGEEDVMRTSFFQLIQGQIGQDKTILDACEQMEYMISAKKTDARLLGLQVKHSPEFLDFIQATIAGMQIKFNDITAFKQTVCKGELLSKRYREDRPEYLPFMKLNRLCDFAQSKIEDYFINNADELKKMLLSHMVDAKHLDVELDRVLQEVKNKAKQQILSHADLDSMKLYCKILQQYCESRELNEDIYVYTIEQLASGCLPFEDALVLLYIRQLTGQIKANRAIRHVLIDEAQDFSLLQHTIIKNFTVNSRFTVLGDVEQAMFPIINIRNKADIQSIYSGKVIELTKSYRSTRQIYDIATKLLDHQQFDYFKRDGSQPVVIQTSDTRSSILQIVNRQACKECHSIGIITKTMKEAEALHELIGSSEIGIIAKSTDSFKSGTLVIPVTLSKGLEFDCVIIPDCTVDGFNTPQDRRMLYLMCTRALHHLFFVCNGELCSFLSPYPDCYETIRQTVNKPGIPENQ